MYAKQEHGVGIERAIHLRKYHPDLYRVEIGQRGRRCYKRGWLDSVAEAESLNPEEENEEDDILSDPAFNTLGAAAARVDLRNMSQYKNADGRFPCPIPYCCKIYKGEQGLIYHVTKSMCEPDVSSSAE